MDQELRNEMNQSKIFDINDSNIEFDSDYIN